MSWETIFTSTVVSAIFNIIKIFLDNKYKLSDTLRVFRYTQLAKILSEWENANRLLHYETHATSLHLSELDRYRNLQQAFSQANPLVDKKYWGDILEQFYTISSDYEIDRYKKMLIDGADILENMFPGLSDTLESEHKNTLRDLKELQKLNDEVEETFKNAIYKQMKKLLRVK